MDISQIQTERYTHAKAMKYGKNGWRAYLEYTENGKRRQRTRKLVTTGRTDKAELAANIEAEDVRRAEKKSGERRVSRAAEGRNRSGSNCRRLPERLYSGQRDSN